MNLSLARCPDFQKVSLTPGSEPRVLGGPGHIRLRGPVRQVVTRTVQGEGKAHRHLPRPLTDLLPDSDPDPDPLHPSALLAVRSDYHCALWKVSKQGQPAPLQVLQVEKGATGISLR